MTAGELLGRPDEAAPEVQFLNPWTLAGPVDNSPRGSIFDVPEVQKLNPTSQTDHSYKTGVEVVPNYRTRTREAEVDDWSPSEPRPSVAYWASVARAAIARGRARAQERQAELDSRRKRQEATK